MEGGREEWREEGILEGERGIKGRRQREGSGRGRERKREGKEERYKECMRG